MTAHNPEQMKAMQELHARLRAAAIERARVDFKAFVRLFMPLVIPMDWWPHEGAPPDEEKGKWLVWGRHIDVICDKLQALADGTLGKKRLMIFLPPGSSKTVIASNLFPAWCLGRWGNWKLLSIGHTVSLAEDKFGRVVRDLIKTPEYQEVFPDRLIKEDKKAAGSWGISSGGIYQNAGAGTSIAGHRANLGILDDILSEQTAMSSTEREHINKWYPQGFTSRLLPNALTLIINTRWHLMDISGYLLKTQPDLWEVISIPALLDAKAAELLGLPEGTSYWPEQWSTEYLQQQKANMPQTQWNALYQQTPIQEDGNILKAKDFMIWDDVEPPEGITDVVITMDTAFSEKSHADYSVILTAGIFKERRPHPVDDSKVMIVPHVILLGVQRGRWSFPTLRDMAFKAVERHKPNTVIIEKKASGQSLIQEFTKAGVPVQEYMPDRDKVSRAHSVTGLLAQHRVWLPKRSWYQMTMDEVAAFPNGEHDDIVDALVMLLIYMRDSWQITLETDAEWGREPVQLKAKKTYW